MLLARQDIQVVIVGDGDLESCGVNCGVDWSSAETIDLANQQIKNKFGNGIQLKYIDRVKSATDDLALELKFGIRNKNMPLPWLIIDGESRISGQFDIRMLIDAIDAEIEIRPHKK